MTQGRNLSRGAAAFAQLAERVGYTDERTVTLGRADGIVVANREQRLVYWHDNRIEGTALLGTSCGIPFAQAERYAGLQVRIARPPNRDDYHVVEIDTAGYYALTGLTPSERLVNQALLPSIGQIETLRLTPAQPASYEVQVRGIYLFYDARGILQLFSASAVDLASVVAGLSTNEHCFVIIYLDETDGTVGYIASATSIAALSLPSRAEFGFADFMAIDVLGEKRPLGAVYCYHAQSAIEEVDFYRAYAFPRFEARGLQHNLTATSAPTSSDDVADGYSVGSLWINVSDDTIYLCADNAASAAVWRQLDATGNGTVTSVGLALPSDVFDVTGSPITGAGTLTGTFSTQASRHAFIAPSGGGTPAFREIEAADIGSGTFGVVRGGTGADLSATGGANQFVKQTSVGGAFTVAGISSGDLTTALTTPPPIGGGTPNAGQFTSLTANSAFTARDAGQHTFEGIADGSVNLNLVFDTWGNSSVGVRYVGRKARGTKANQAVILAGDELLVLDGRGHNGSVMISNAAASLGFLAAENWGVSANGSLIRMIITLDGTITQAIATDIRTLSGAPAMIINGDGNTPSSTLDIVGDVEIGSENAYLMGDPTANGSWRITRSGNNLVIQRRENGTWVTKQTISA